MKILNKKNEDLPVEVENELKKLPRRKRKRALELYKLYQEGKVINLKEIISNNKER